MSHARALLPTCFHLGLLLGFDSEHEDCYSETSAVSGLYADIAHITACFLRMSFGLRNLLAPTSDQESSDLKMEEKMFLET
jgi:hypothetical protein